MFHLFGYEIHLVVLAVIIGFFLVLLALSHRAQEARDQNASLCERLDKLTAGMAIVSADLKLHSKKTSTPPPLLPEPRSTRTFP